jgi:hypothetical protein
VAATGSGGGGASTTAKSSTAGAAGIVIVSYVSTVGQLATGGTVTSYPVSGAIPNSSATTTNFVYPLPTEGTKMWVHTFTTTGTLIT